MTKTHHLVKPTLIAHLYIHFCSIREYAVMRTVQFAPFPGKQEKIPASVAATALCPKMKNIERSTSRQTDVHLKHPWAHVFCGGKSEKNASMHVKLHKNTQSQQETEARAVLHNTAQRRVRFKATVFHATLAGRGRGHKCESSCNISPPKQRRISVANIWRV